MRPWTIEEIYGVGIPVPEGFVIGEVEMRNHVHGDTELQVTYLRIGNYGEVHGDFTPLGAKRPGIAFATEASFGPYPMNVGNLGG